MDTCDELKQWKLDGWDVKVVNTAVVGGGQHNSRMMRAAGWHRPGRGGVLASCSKTAQEMRARDKNARCRKWLAADIEWGGGKQQRPARGRWRDFWH
uniref:Uncharacterized protein n=1 Tax=Leersia perrieri TaxID=77586 RepID=A0A0D9V310_9ORYZ